MSEQVSETLEALEERLRTVWDDLGYAVAVNHAERIEEGIAALQEITRDHGLISRACAIDRMRAIDITRRTLAWLRGAWPREGWPQFHTDLDRAETGLNEAVEAKDLAKIDWWLNECWTVAMPLRTQDAREASTRRRDDDILGLSPEVRRLIEEHPTQAEEPTEG